MEKTGSLCNPGRTFPCRNCTLFENLQYERKQLMASRSRCHGWEEQEKPQAMSHGDFD